VIGLAERMDDVALATLLLVIVATPWPLGSRLAWASMLFAGIVIAVAVLWTAARLLAGSSTRALPFAAPVAAFLAWTGSQWAFGTTIYAHGTAFEWVRYLSYAAAFLMALNLAADERRARRLQRAVMWTGVAVGLFGLLQFLTWNGKLFWVYEPYLGGTAFGPFNNRNYFAGYLVATLPVAVAALLGGTRRRRWLLMLGVWASSLAVLLSLSRGGTVALVAAVACAWLLSRPAAGPTAERRRRLAFGAAVGVASLIVGLVWLDQADRVIARLETILDLQSTASMVNRTDIWRDTLPMAIDRPLAGFGLNTYVWALPAYRRTPTSFLETNAHNEYLEMLVETGVVGVVLCVWFLAALLRGAIGRLAALPMRSRRARCVGAVSAWTGILVYGLTDFPTIIPAIDYVLAVLAGLMVAVTAPRAVDPPRRRHGGSRTTKRRRSVVVKVAVAR